MAQAQQKSGPLIADADIHASDSPAALAPYIVQPWRKSLEMMASRPHGYLDVSGYSPGLRADPPIPGGHPKLAVKTAQEMRSALDDLGIAAGIIVPDYLLLFAILPNIEYATALYQAYNRWLCEQWLDESNGLYGAIVACPQNPEDTVQEIEKYAGKPGVCAIYLPTAGVNPLWGHRRYDKIMAAAQAADLPLLLHSVSAVTPSFPMNMDQFENHWARQCISHPFAMMSNLTSIMHTGVPVRYPKLKFVFTEAGLTWVPFLMLRMDRYHAEYRRVVPILEEPPSVYIKRQMWFATQPIEEPDNPQYLVEAIRQMGGADRVMFASDWPHHDFDHPRAVNRLPLTPDERHKIMWQNAADVFRLKPPAARSAAA